MHSNANVLFLFIYFKINLLVVVVTTSNGAHKRGITSSSFASVSLAPPIISFAVKKPR